MSTSPQASRSHWQMNDDPHAFPLPAAWPADAGVVVIGGGIMGVATTYWLARMGVDVLLVEAHSLAWGATGRNAGLMLAGSRPLEDPNLVRTVIREEGIDAEYATPGHLALATNPEMWDKISQEADRRRNTPSPIYALDHAACEDLLGMRISPRFLGGRWFPHGGLVHPTRLVYGLAHAAQRRGARLLTQTPVLRVERVGQDRLVIHTSRGWLHAQHIVYACHSALVGFVPQFRRVITAVRGQVMSTYPLPRLFNVGLGIDWGSVYWRQATDGAIVLGGCRHLDPQTETSDALEVNPHIQAALAQFLTEVFPDFPTLHVRYRWAGIMDSTADGRPMIGALPGQSFAESQGRPNEWVIAGFGGHGLPVGLGAGRALAEAIVSAQTPACLEPYQPGRFAAPV